MQRTILNQNSVFSSCDESDQSDREEDPSEQSSNLHNNDNDDDSSNSNKELVPENDVNKPSKMRDVFVSFSLFIVVTILTHGMGGPSPFVLPTANKVNSGTPLAAAPPNLRVRHAPPPTPFFGPNSAIDDYYGGDVYAAFAEADLHENALIFYYAPWDADSRATRTDLEMIAEIFAYTELYIGAVNCWTPKGECFKQVNLS